MNKIDKKIIDSIDLLSKTMIKNNLSEIEISDGDFSLKLKKFIKDNQVLKNNEVFEKSTQKENEPSLLEKALKISFSRHSLSFSRSRSEKICRGWSECKNWSSSSNNRSYENYERNHS